MKSGLKPQHSTNYDLSVEYYFEPAGVLSAGYFRKNIRDFIARGTEEIPGGADNGFGGDYAGWTITQNRNIGSARIRVRFGKAMLPSEYDPGRIIASVPSRRPRDAPPLP